MRFIKFIKSNWIDVALVVLVAGFFFMYFVVYLTPSKQAWYVEMYNQASHVVNQLIRIGKKIL